MFEDWLEQEQATLASLSHPEGNVDTLERTLQQLQVLLLWGVVHYVIVMNRECTTTTRESFLVSVCTLINTWLKAKTEFSHKALDTLDLW